MATRMDDCGLWQAVWLEPHAVHRLRRTPSGPPAVMLGDWDDIVAVPPIEPDGSWSRRWEAAVGVALAHLAAVTEGRPVTLPAGPVAQLLGAAVATFLTAGPPAGSLDLAGPGIAAVLPTPDVLLVPRHPLTGETWRPASGPAAAVVPLDAGVWAHLARPREISPLPASEVQPQSAPFEALRADRAKASRRPSGGHSQRRGPDPNRPCAAPHLPEGKIQAMSRDGEWSAFS
ncbi:hypothetical protein ACFWHQ_08705 [Streptomyces sp. NPDC060334]|uniref:hypothetical protein n=1 Tax=unclassified Streptomyces TaxID=2593676 RepID=UPI0033265FA2